MEEIAKKLEAREVAKLETNRLECDFGEQSHETGACLPTSSGLSEEQVKFMGAVTRQQRYPFSNNFNSNWPNCSNFFSVGSNGVQSS